LTRPKLMEPFQIVRIPLQCKGTEFFGLVLAIPSEYD
jgi:hypothetical protein